METAIENEKSPATAAPTWRTIVDAAASRARAVIGDAPQLSPVYLPNVTPRPDPLDAAGIQRPTDPTVHAWMARGLRETEGRALVVEVPLPDYDNKTLQQLHAPVLVEDAPAVIEELLREKQRAALAEARLQAEQIAAAQSPRAERWRALPELVRLFLLTASAQPAGSSERRICLALARHVGAARGMTTPPAFDAELERATMQFGGAVAR